MPQTSNERARLTRDRRRRGVRPVLVEVSQDVIEFLEVNGYLADRSDAAIAGVLIINRVLHPASDVTTTQTVDGCRRELMTIADDRYKGLIAPALPWRRLRTTGMLEDNHLSRGKKPRQATW